MCGKKCCWRETPTTSIQGRNCAFSGRRRVHGDRRRSAECHSHAPSADGRLTDNIQSPLKSRHCTVGLVTTKQFLGG
jgi:hypothetical protein